MQGVSAAATAWATATPFSSMLMDTVLTYTQVKSKALNMRETAESLWGYTQTAMGTLLILLFPIASSASFPSYCLLNAGQQQADRSASWRGLPLFMRNIVINVSWQSVVAFRLGRHYLKANYIYFRCIMRRLLAPDTWWDLFYFKKHSLALWRKQKTTNVGKKLPSYIMCQAFFVVEFISQ